MADNLFKPALPPRLKEDDVPGPPVGPEVAGNRPGVGEGLHPGAGMGGGTAGDIFRVGAGSQQQFRPRRRHLLPGFEVGLCGVPAQVLHLPQHHDFALAVKFGEIGGRFGDALGGRGPAVVDDERPVGGAEQL